MLLMTFFYHISDIINSFMFTSQCILSILPSALKGQEYPRVSSLLSPMRLPFLKLETLMYFCPFIVVHLSWPPLSLSWLDPVCFLLQDSSALNRFHLSEEEQNNDFLQICVSDCLRRIYSITQYFIHWRNSIYSCLQTQYLQIVLENRDFKIKLGLHVY